MTIKDRVWGLLAGEECYVVLDKGPIVDSHVLVLPVEHYPSQLSLSASSFAEMERYLSALRSCFASQVTSCSIVPGQLWFITGGWILVFLLCQS